MRDTIKKLFPETIIHKKYLTNSSFHVNYGKNMISVFFFLSFMLALAKLDTGLSFFAV